jgi:hypothetical protein
MAWTLRREGCHNINWVGGEVVIHLHAIVDAIVLLGRDGIGAARLGTISSGESETIMCGRVRLSSDYSEIKIRLKFAPNSVAPNVAPDWNKPPTAPMLVAIRSVNGERVPKMMKWGLIPHWAKDDKLQFSTFNARAEEFTTKPAFRDAWKRGQRCLVVTDGFYEWKKLAI